MAGFRTLDDLDVKGKRVVVRADLNVPVTDGKVSDATRIEAAARTVRELVNLGASVLVLSHFGRPKGKAVAGMSLEPIAPALEAAIGRPVRFVATDWTDDRADQAAAAAKPGDILLFENTRFHPGEETNDKALAKTFAALGDLFVNDAFSAAHRAHASTEGIASHLPAAAGRTMEAELTALAKALAYPKRPVIAIVGGAKISTKIDLLGNLTARVDQLAIGGAMANTFLAAEGYPVGKSLCERDSLETAREIAANAQARGCEIVLPRDVVVATAFEANAPHRICGLDEVGEDEMILDIGPDSIAGLIARLDTARTVVWNGPFGAFELPPFDAGTNAVARHVANLTATGHLLSVAGGGDTVSALNRAGVVGELSFVSTAGGAFLEWLEGKTLPGVAVLQKAAAR
jgi:phosphoglycerate kinase